MIAKPTSMSTPSTAIPAVRTSMLDGLAQLADYFGFPKVVGQIYGVLLLSDKPLCLDDLMVELDISKANASINIRTLENVGMVRQVWVRGSSGRRKFYEAETDFAQIMANILKGRELRDVDRAINVMQENIDRLNAAMPDLSDEERQRAALFSERIERMQALFQFAQGMIGLVLMRVSSGDGLDVPLEES
jgi:DNA-binding transcriptional regulator GbsR (MarR family)